MADMTWITDEIKKDIEKRIRNTMQSVTKGNIGNVKKTRNKIINKWFGEFNGYDFSADKNNIVKTNFKANGLTGTFQFDSWTESSTLEPHRSAERWLAKWGGDKPSNEYVADLVFNEGIIGLPQYATTYEDNHNGEKYNGQGWSDSINLHFHQKTPLSIVIDGSEEWDKLMDIIEEEFLSKI